MPYLRFWVVFFSTEVFNLATVGKIILDKMGNALASAQQLELLPQGMGAQTQHGMAAI